MTTPHFTAAATYHVRVTKDQLVFSSAHFITYNVNVCERLHGHNWRLAVELEGPLDQNQYVFDFLALRDAAQTIVARLDHRVLLPTRHPLIDVAADAREVVVRFEQRRWVFPREDCVLLPIENTTAERLAWWIAQELVDLIPRADLARLTRLQVELEENFGQWAVCCLPLGGNSHPTIGP